MYLARALFIISAVCTLVHAHGPWGPHGWWGWRRPWGFRESWGLHESWGSHESSGSRESWRSSESWSSGGPLVKTTLGYVQGVTTERSQNFYGIPFAQPPVNDLRWKSPVPATAWASDDVYDATTMKADCAQAGCEYFLPPAVCPTQISEDCLYLNIYTPLDVARSSRLLAVMVSIPGGGFQINAASSFYRGDVFVEKADVILVTISYRIGVFGFLVTDQGAEPATGNYGLQDQRMALQWIHENIENFGGDPNKVTLFGQSSGAQSIAYHMTSSKADHLFHRAIFQSLPFSIPTKSYDDAVAQGVRVANVLKCDGADVLGCLSRKPWQELAAAMRPASGFEGTLQQYEPWGPHIDDDEVVQQMLGAFLSGDFAPKPLIMGTVSEEGLSYIMSEEPVNAIAYATSLLQIFGPKGCLIFNRYPPSPSSLSDLRPQLVNVATDFVFTCSNLAVARYISIKPDLPNVWHYIYDQPLPLNSWQHLAFCEGRVCHGSELPLVFQTAEIQGFYEYSDDELSLSDSIITYWSNFAKYGNPNAPWGWPYAFPTWSAYGHAKRSMLFKAPKNRIIWKYNEAMCKFWEIFATI